MDPEHENVPRQVETLPYYIGDQQYLVFLCKNIKRQRRKHNDSKACIKNKQTNKQTNYRNSSTGVLFNFTYNHVTSYEANFASHHTRDSHVGFLLAWYGIGSTTKCSATFYQVHTTIPNYNIMTRI